MEDLPKENQENSPVATQSADSCEKVSDTEVSEIPSFPRWPSGTGSRPEAGRLRPGQRHPDSETQDKFPNSSLRLPGLLLKVWVLPEGRVLESDS